MTHTSPLISRVLAVLAVVAVTVGFVLPSTASAATCKSYVYGYGGTGTCVKRIQTILNTASKHIGNVSYGTIAVDGSYGKATTSAVKAFQKQYGHISADGVVGPNTWNQLCKAMNMGVMSGYYGHFADWTNGIKAARASGCNI